MPISHEIFRISKKETYHIHHETKLYNIYENKANPWFWPKFCTCLHRKVRWVQAEIGPFPVKVHRLLDPVYTIGARLAVRALGRCQLQPRFRPIKIRARAKGTPLPLYCYMGALGRLWSRGYWKPPSNARTGSCLTMERISRLTVRALDGTTFTRHNRDQCIQWKGS